MSAQPSFRKAASHARRSSTGHGGIRPNCQLLSPIRRRLITFEAIYPSFTCPATLAQLAALV